MGDGDGVMVIPQRDAPAALAKARKKLTKELATREAIAAGTWDRSQYTEEALRRMGCEIVDGSYEDHAAGRLAEQEQR